MESIANNQLTFQSTIFHPVDHIGGIWFTSSELAKALDYRKSDAVTQIYNRYHDEFTEKMSTTLKMRVIRKTGVANVLVRIFSLRGAHLIAMFATTPIAKKFRKWVLDILDNEIVQGNAHPSFDFETALHNVRAINIHLRAIKEMWRGGLEDALKLMEYKYHGNISERLADMTFFSSPLEISLSQHQR